MLTTVTATPGADGHAVYSIPVPPNRFGPVVVRATGTNTVGQPFTIETSGTIVACPAPLPATGSSGIGNWLRGGTAAVVAGVALLIVAMRRRQHALGGTGVSVNDDQPSPSAVDRRAALKKAAAAAGIVAWATPTRAGPDTRRRVMRRPSRTASRPAAS